MAFPLRLRVFASLLNSAALYLLNLPGCTDTKFRVRTVALPQVIEKMRLPSQTDSKKPFEKPPDLTQRRRDAEKRREIGEKAQ